MNILKPLISRRNFWKKYNSLHSSGWKMIKDHNTVRLVNKKYRRQYCPIVAVAVENGMVGNGDVSNCDAGEIGTFKLELSRDFTADIMHGADLNYGFMSWRLKRPFNKTKSFI